MSRNIKALHELADFIESRQFAFDFGDVYVRPQCGTAGCIAGHAAALWPEVRGCGDALHFTWADDKLEALLGLTSKETSKLFVWPVDIDGADIEYSQVTRQMAVAAVRRFADTGEIWF